MHNYRSHLSLFRRRPWIKICGLTDPQAALACATLGADAIGLVFYEKSPRNLSTDQGAAITRVLPPSVLPVGVFVDHPLDAIKKKVTDCGLKGVQLHGSESPELVKSLRNQGLIVIKTLFASRAPRFSRANSYEDASYLLVEYGNGALPGGNAQTWDYGMCKNALPGEKLILAGGLTETNIKNVVRQMKPAGVDVSSGVEKAPGIKDLSKVARFMECVRP